MNNAKHEAGGRPFIVVDGMNIAYMARYAYKKLSNRGRSVAMYYGFMKMVQSIITRHGWRPEKLIIAWDGDPHPKRLEWLPTYKGHRWDKREPGEESNFRSQIVRLRKFLRYMGVCQVHNPAVEGDDQIYLVTQKYLKLAKVTIISGDKDMLQMVNHDVQVYNPRNDALYVPRLVGAGNYGMDCDKIVDFYCLVGDKSDDIPGINGIGEVRAAKFLNAYGSVNKYLNDKHAEWSGFMDKVNLAKVYKRNKRLMDLKWFCDKFYTDEDITYYKDEQNPEFNQEKYTQFCLEYGLKTYMLPKFMDWIKNFQT